MDDRPRTHLSIVVRCVSHGHFVLFQPPRVAIPELHRDVVFRVCSDLAHDMTLLPYTLRAVRQFSICLDIVDCLTLAQPHRTIFYTNRSYPVDELVRDWSRPGPLSPSMCSLMYIEKIHEVDIRLYFEGNLFMLPMFNEDEVRTAERVLVKILKGACPKI
jgi:hypothetical protein